MTERDKKRYGFQRMAKAYQRQLMGSSYRQHENARRWVLCWARVAGLLR